MMKYHTHSFAFILLLVALSISLMSPSFPIQAIQSEQSKISAHVSPDSVTVRVFDIDNNQPDALLPQAGTDASWVHGHSLTLEQPTSLTLTCLGYGGVVTIPATPTVAGGHSGWLHLAIPTPVLVGSVRAKLNRVLFHYKPDPSGGIIDRVHVWDGANRIYVNDNLTLWGSEQLATFNFTEPPSIWRGVGISIHVRGCMFFSPPGCDANTIQFISAGADFTY
jgi:hypothetical protein